LDVSMGFAIAREGAREEISDSAACVVMAREGGPPSNR
jgi:hypothetical protein